MKVLIGDIDLFKVVGGGQAFYRAIVERHPEIEFSYIRISEGPDATRPANAHPIDFKEPYRPDESILPNRAFTYNAFRFSCNMAASVAGEAFDLVDLPDYRVDTGFLRPAMEAHSVGFERFAISMHGLSSIGYRNNWPCREPDPAIPQMEALEQHMFESADLRYAISEAYIDWSRGRCPGLAFQYYHPLYFFKLPEVIEQDPGGGPPDLNFLGRRAGIKGADLFLKLLVALPRSAYGSARIMGDDVKNSEGTPSGAVLGPLMEGRDLGVEITGAYTKHDLRRVWGERSITVLTSRWDTLNLVALESLFSGVPTVISRHAGACRFLDEAFPSVPYTRIDPFDSSESARLVTPLLSGYDRARADLLAGLERADRRPSGLELPAIYGQPPSFSAAGREALCRAYDRLFERQPKP
ncbi:MAG: glycosyltransferase [Fimbriimonas ginsengisoli]|uniref:Glycosyltransferase n=1 Tax=Fimbriimonas ginsengisoli TaxID=1005039 RepID=A0A931LSJ8_FIMGI|nr:glycosyltransferase [Fimbriimonas ginsengisoli]MBI3722227.1 glycosyltransferase [Fimbriimonas ginsengisoli]